MAQTNFTPISLYYSTTAAAVPSAGNLVAGELAINTQDGKLFYKDAAGVVQTLASKDVNSGTFTNISVSGVASFADGTVSLPSITNIGDTNTGIFFPAADTIAFSEGGTEAMRLDSSGNVGIGTSSPANKLEVVGGTGTQNLALFRTGDGTAANNAGGGFVGISSATAGSRSTYMWLDADGANLTGSDYFYIEKKGNSGAVELIQVSNAAMTFQTNSVERMRVLSTGNILSLAGGSTTATGTGIAFPATQNASSDANTLDDYEEGSWTPTLTASSGSVTYNSITAGVYQKIGNRVNCFGLIQLASTSLSGQLFVSGLPFTSNGDTSFSRTPVYIGRATGWNAAPIGGAMVVASTTSFELYKYTTNSNATDSFGADTTSSSSLWFAISYMAQN